MEPTTTSTMTLHDANGTAYRKHIMVRDPRPKDPTVRTLVWVKPDVFVKAWKKTDPHATGVERDEKYQKIEKTMADSSYNDWPLEVSSVSVGKDGVIGFMDGRHRFAYLYANGYDPIPVGMDAASVRHAQQRGYLTSAPSTPTSLAERLIEEFR